MPGTGRSERWRGVSNTSRQTRLVKRLVWRLVWLVAGNLQKHSSSLHCSPTCRTTGCKTSTLPWPWRWKFTHCLSVYDCALNFARWRCTRLCNRGGLGACWCDSSGHCCTRTTRRAPLQSITSRPATCDEASSTAQLAATSLTHPVSRHAAKARHLRPRIAPSHGSSRLLRIQHIAARAAAA